MWLIQFTKILKGTLTLCFMQMDFANSNVNTTCLSMFDVFKIIAKHHIVENYDFLKSWTSLGSNGQTSLAS